MSRNTFNKCFVKLIEHPSQSIFKVKTIVFSRTYRTDIGFEGTVGNRKHLESLEITFRITLRWVGRKVLTSKNV